MKLNYRAFGESKEVMVIIHGLFGSLDNWATLAKGFAKDYTVYIVDQRNHGKSPHAAVHDYTHMAEDLKEFMDDHSISSAFIVGHSMGGKTAMQFATMYPNRIEKLCIVDIGPKYYPPHHQEIVDALVGVVFDQVSTRKEVEDQLQVTISNVGIRLFLMKNLTRTTEGGYRWKMNLPVIVKHIENIGEGLAKDVTYDGETLFIRGEKSDYILDDDFAHIIEQFPVAKLITIPNAGHWVHAEQPKLLFEEVLKFTHE